jgi:hypothetical protein
MLRVWRFEDQPASSSSPEEVYLRGVEISDVIVFIAGSDTSEPTAQEISSAIAWGKDILCFRLPSETRSMRVIDLVERIRANGATTKDVPSDEQAFRTEVVQAIKGWLVGRARQAPPQRRSHRLRTRLTESKARTVQLWLTAGLSERLADDYASDDGLSTYADSIVLDAETPFRIIVAPAGSGKSLALERILQRYILSAMDDVLAPFPVRLTARNITGSLASAMRAELDEPGSMDMTGVALVVDELDEVDEGRAEQLLEEANELVRAHPRCRVATGGRHAPAASMARFVLELPPFDAERTERLIERTGGVEAARAFKLADANLRETLSRPLFAIIYSLNYRSGATNESGLVDILIDKALSRAERAAATAHVFLNFAARLLDASEGSVPTASVPAPDQIELLQTRLVFEDGDTLRIPLRIVAEQAAANWLTDREPGVALAKACDESLSGRWLPALARYLSTRSDSEAREFVIELCRSDILLAFRLAREDDTARKDPWTRAALQFEMDEAAAAVQGAFSELFNLRPFRVTVDDQIRSVVFECGRHGGPIRRITQFGWPKQTRHAALFSVKQHLVRFLDEVLESRALTTEAPALREEMLWNFGRIMLGRGSLTQEALPINAIEAELIDKRPGLMPVRDGSHRVLIDLNALGERLVALRSAGRVTWDPPFIPGDETPPNNLPAASGPFQMRSVWLDYSDAALLEWRKQTVVGAMQAYASIADTWLGVLKRGLRKRVTMPAVYLERLWRVPSGELAATWYWKPRPTSATNMIDISFEEPFQFADAVADMQEAASRFRPGELSRLETSFASGFMRLGRPWPVRELAYEWLYHDLRALGLCGGLALNRW